MGHADRCGCDESVEATKVYSRRALGSMVKMRNEKFRSIFFFGVSLLVEVAILHFRDFIKKTLQNLSVKITVNYSITAQ